jgi:hypothetical protein
MTNNSDIPESASYFGWVGDAGWFEGAELAGLRFVVTGTVIPEPDTWLLAAVSIGLLLADRRWKRPTVG